MKKSLEDRIEHKKLEFQRAAEENFWRSLVNAARELLPTEMAAVVGEYTKPEAIEPMLYEGFRYMVRNLEIPLGEVRIVVGYNDRAKKMVYAVEVVNVHDAKWYKVEFPMSIFMGNVFDSVKRQKTATSMKESIKFMRFFKVADPSKPLFLEGGKVNGGTFTKDGAPLQLNMSNT